MSRALKIIFTSSVVLNLLLLGVLGGMFYQRWQHMPANHPDMRESVAPQTRHLIARHFRDNRDQMRSHMEDMRTVRKALMDVMEADKFDRVAYDAVVEQLIAGQDERMTLYAEMIGAVAEGLPAEERRKLVGKLLRMGGGHMERRGPRQGNQGGQPGASK